MEIKPAKQNMKKSILERILDSIYKPEIKHMESKKNTINDIEFYIIFKTNDTNMYKYIIDTFAKITGKRHRITPNNIDEIRKKFKKKIDIYEMLIPIAQQK